MALTIQDLKDIEKLLVEKAASPIHDRIDTLAKAIDGVTLELQKRPCAIHADEIEAIKSQVGKLIVIKDGASKMLIWALGICGPLLTAALMKALKL